MIKDARCILNTELPKKYGIVEKVKWNNKGWPLEISSGKPEGNKLKPLFAISMMAGP